MCTQEPRGFDVTEAAMELGAEVWPLLSCGYAQHAWKLYKL
jgi:hypothetical protein